MSWPCLVPGSSLLTYLILITGIPTLACDDSENKPPLNKIQPKVTLGTDTTYIQGPLDKDGHVDYLRAYNDKLGRRPPAERNLVAQLLLIVSSFED
ncbi:MAG: hypothetical protein RMI91_07525 [Gemmatales bacterium]|nr:hypothetical protein [Gemmatales bacterium]MDW7994490.1 hypothetical protein [Gemmatales bacterium]